MFFKFLTLSLAVFSFIAWQGCNNSTNTPTTKTVTTEHHLNKANSRQLLSIGVGDTFDITQQNIGPGEYDTSVISSSTVQCVTETPGTLTISSGLTPASFFAATGRGNAEITIKHTGEVATAADSDNTFRLSCKVE